MVYGQTGSGKSYTMEGYEYVMAEKRARQHFGSNANVGREMKALISTVDEDSQGVSLRTMNEFFIQLEKVKAD